MHGDKKIGLALGIFLVGIVGAFFFRNDVDELAGAPQMVNPDAIDDQIAERSVTPYLARRREMTQLPDETVRSRYVPETRAYDMPQFLRDDPNSRTHDLFGPPDPIPLTDQPSYERHTRTMVQPVVPDPIEPYEEATPQFQTREYKIQSNDTLSDLAERFLGASGRYKEIFELNRDRLKSPNDIRLGQTILIPLPGQVAQSTAPVRTARQPAPDYRRSEYLPKTRPEYRPESPAERPREYDRDIRNEYAQEPPQPSRRTIYIERERVAKPRVVVQQPEPKRRRKLVLQSIGGGSRE